MANSSPRRIVKAKRVLPSVPPESPRLKSVTFNDEIIETSIGGTQRVGKIRQDVLLHFDAPVTSNGLHVSSKQINQNVTANGSKVKSNGRPSSSTQSGKENKNKISTTNEKNSLESTASEEAKNKLCMDNLPHQKEKMSPAKSKMTTSSSSNSKSSKSADKMISKTSIENQDAHLDHQPSCDTPAENTEKKERKEKLTGEDRRTTIERINIVAQSPFRTPDAKQSRRHTLESKLFATPDCYRDVNFGTPRRMLPMIQDESMEILEDGEDSCSIMVAVRVRPFGQRELADSNTKCVVSMCDNETTVTTENGTVHRFAYDFSFWSHDRNSEEFSTQESVYTRLAQPLLGKAFEGYNTCLFAYGQTGSGKSYCIMGTPNETGIIPRFCAELFSRADSLTTHKRVKVNVEISFFEIYNEKIHDLLASSKEKGSKKTTLKVREHPVLGPYVEGLSTYVVNSFDDVEGWITLGNKNRATAATGMNDKSSRSHSVFTIVLTQTKTETIEGQEHDHSVNSKINLVDLAGSERQSLANTSGERLREGANINKSLLTLGKVISLLSERSASSKKRKIFIPYRDSVLTWLLKESLGGNSKTAMIATISPASQHVEETLSTLRYAHQARSIVNLVHINEDPKAKIIRELRAEIERLRAEQGGVMNEEALAASMSEISRLKSEMEELSRSWQERLRQAEAKKAEELKLLERAGITFKVDNRLPNLVNLNEDPQLSEMLLYVIKDGETRVGRKIEESQHDIKLTGALIADNHCVITSKKGKVEITPIGDAPTYVNGDLISQKTLIHHGDRVILGGDHYFRFNHPMEVQKNKGERASSDIKDFDFARQELHRVQEARLQAEVEDKLDQTRKEMMEQKDGYENKLKGLESVLTKVEQTHKEAQSTIHSLKKQNMMLEQEVLAGRKRQKLESTLSQQSLDDLNLSKSKIVELLEAETKQVAERLEKLRSKRSEMVTPARLGSTQEAATLAPSIATGSPSSRRDLYKVALLLREANKINQYLNTSLVFSREDVPDEDNTDRTQTQIRVINTRHRMFTLWTVSKFEDKLAQMRDLYQNEGDTSADDDEVFNDAEDVWEKESSISSPVCLQNGLKNIPKNFGLGKSTPVMNFRREPVSLYSPRSGQDVEMSMVRACKSLLSSVGDNLTALNFEESVVDKILSTCQRIKDSTAAVVGSDSKKIPNASPDTSWARPMLQLVADVHLLASHTTLWSSFYDGLQSSLLRDLLARSTDQVKVIGHQATSLLQGCEGRLTSLMSESGHKLTTAILALCETCGELALATDSQVLRLDHSARDYHHSQLCSEVSQSFLNGCNRFANRTVQGGLVSVENCEQRCSQKKDEEDATSTSDEMSQRLLHVLSCIRSLLQRTLNVQQELSRDRRVTTHDEVSPQFYSTTYKRLQGVVSNVSSVVDSSTLLVESAEPLVQGISQDGKRLERCAELIQRSCQRLLSVSSYTYTPPSSFVSQSLSSSSLTTSDELKKAQEKSTGSSISFISTSSSTSSFTSVSTASSETVTNNNNSKDTATASEITLLSESQLGQLDSATQEVAMAMSLFTEYTRKTWSNSPERGITTPRGRRLLPPSPEKAVVTPALNAAHLRRLNMKRTITLADRGVKAN